MPLDLALILARTQEALQLNDEQMADYLEVNVPALRELRAGTEDLPSHAAFDLLDTAGFIGATDFSMHLLVLTKRAREKLRAARAKRALTIAQKNRLARLRRELQREHQLGQADHPEAT